MKRINEIGVYKSGNLRVEVVDLKDLKATVDEKTAVFVGHTTVTSRIGGEDFSASYEISREYLRKQAQWQMVKSERAPWRIA
jgi:hypothetical protein